MKDYENPFTLSFGNRPYRYVSRENDKNELAEKLMAKTPVARCFIISGVRGSGKTVMLTSLSSMFAKLDDWVVIDLNPDDDMREGLAAKLYSSSSMKHLFLEKNFGFSFHGFSFSVSGKTPILHIDDLLDRMLSLIKAKGKKVLVTIDEMTNTKYLRQFILSFQMLIRKDYPLFIVGTGLYENISSIENEGNLTFLLRAPKIILPPLSLPSIASLYEESLSLNREAAVACAKVTKGYALAFQVLGYLMFEAHKRAMDDELMSEFDNYMSDFAYAKIWSSLSGVERKIVSAFDDESPIEIGALLKKLTMSKEYFSRYRDRLLKKGVLVAPSHGLLSFALPRFKAFIDNALAFGL